MCLKHVHFENISLVLSVLFGNGLLFYRFFSGKIVSPKWKNFRGIKVKLKDKIRLNNIIWREWHRQCM